MPADSIRHGGGIAEMSAWKFDSALSRWAVPISVWFSKNTGAHRARQVAVYRSSGVAELHEKGTLFA
jgi:hypothetical protein